MLHAPFAKGGEGGFSNSGRPEIPPSPFMKRGAERELHSPGMKEYDVWSFIWGGLALCLMGLCLAGCQQEMANEPRYKPLAASTFFEDGRSARDLVSGTVARGQLHLEEPLYTGRAQGTEVTDLPLPLTHE